MAPLTREIEELLQANTRIRSDAVCSHPMATVRVDVPLGSPPVYRYMYNLPKFKHDAVDSQVEEWLRDGIIEKCPRSSPWNMQLVVVTKATEPGSPQKFRVCIDPRAVNALTPDDPHPLPHILEYLDDACGAVVFTSLDLKGSFHQFNVEPAHRHILAFTWGSIQYQFRRGPFGLKALAGQFQRVMSAILGDLPYVRVYIDDIIIFSNDIIEHMRHVAEVIRRLNKHSLKIQPPKCRFIRPCVPYLGHVVSGAGIKIAQSRVLEIADVPRPATGKQMMSFLGMVNFIRNFIPCLATVAAPLDALRQRKHIDLDDPRVWTSACEGAFHDIKEAVRRAPILCKPDWNGKFSVATDASGVGLGAVLFQGTPEDPRYIVCASRALTRSERNYSATKKELLGVMFALRKLRYYLAGRRFTMYTDHKALTYMLQQKKLNDMLERWLDEILDFDFEIHHIPGILNVLPDCLSRLYSIPDQDHLRQRATLVALQSLERPFTPDLHLDGPSCVDGRGVSDWVPLLPAFMGEVAEGVPDGRELDTDLWLASLEDEGPRPCGASDGPAILRALAAVTRGRGDRGAPAARRGAAPLLDARADDSALAGALTQPGEGVEITPESERAEALSWAHAQGHKGSRGTLHRLLSEGFRWPNMEKDCLRVARECIDCQRYTVSRHGYHPLRSVTAALPLDHLAMDLASMPTSACGMNYILVIIDVCTRFVWLHPLPDKAGATVSAKLLDFIMTFGKPQIIQSDNGSEFSNLGISRLLATAGVDHRHVTAYYPQGNGVAERAVRTVKGSLLAHIRGDTSTWPSKIPMVQYAYNTTVHNRHGSTPFSLLFARAHNPLRGEPAAQPGRSLGQADLAQRLRLMHDVVFPAMAERSRIAAERVYDAFARKNKIIADDFPQGSLVMRQNKLRSAKVDPAWEGPYMVVRRSRGGAYVLRDTTRDELSQRVPASQLKLISYEGNLSPDSFEVEKIVDHSGTADDRKYLVRWKNFSPQHDSWVDARDVLTLGCVTEYWSRLRKAAVSPSTGASGKRRRPGRDVDPLGVPVTGIPEDSSGNPPAAPRRRRVRARRR
jgi:transposase InsO family protein